MKKHAVLSSLMLVILLGVCLFPAHAQTQAPFAKVHILLPGEDLEVKIKKLGLRYYSGMPPEAPGDAFLVIPAPNTHLEVFEVAMNEDASLRLGERQYFMEVSQPNIGFVLRHIVPESMPNLALCIMDETRQRHCWIPRYDGVSGALVLDAGFSPVREKGENIAQKRYSYESEPLLTGPELMDQPLFFVKRLQDAKELAKLVAEYKFTPKGKILPGKPHNILFMPLVVPAKVSLHIMEFRGGDGYINPKAVQEITLGDNDAAVFSLDLISLINPKDPGNEDSYAFLIVDSDNQKHFWMPQINRESGTLEGGGLGPMDKFMHWPYD